MGAESSAGDTGLSGKNLQCRSMTRLHHSGLANTIELYQKKNCNCFGCGSPDHLVKDCTKDLGKSARKVGLNLKEEMVKKGRPDVSECGSCPTGYPRQSPPWLKDVLESFLLKTQIGVDLKTYPRLRSMMRAVGLS